MAVRNVVLEKAEGEAATAAITPVVIGDQNIENLYGDGLMNFQLRENLKM